MLPEQLAEIIARGREQSNVEFKGAGPRTSKPLFARVVRAVLSMANRRDGGFVILGVAESRTGLEVTGLKPDDLQTWNYDDVADSIARYADPSVDFDVISVTHGSATSVVIRVEEFAEVPVLCRRDFNEGSTLILREGACYIRPRRKPESIEVCTYADMRDLFDLATEKGVRRFVTRAHAAGIPLVPGAPIQTDAERFDAQLEDFR